ncbi:MAG: serine/threonine protein kinase [Cellvibrionaceae bacterium]
MTQTDYYALTPDAVINAVESLGYLSDSRILALNSYENRVYQVGIEDEQPIIAKFYRPNRWTDEQIIEEHRFTLHLSELDIPVVPPLLFDGKSLLNYEGYRFALYTRRGGHAPELDNGDHLEVIGRFIGRIHSVGKQQTFEHRPTISSQHYANDSRDYLLNNDFIPTDLIPAYETLARDLIARIDSVFSQSDYNNIRLHGDCHPGNILWRDDHAHFVDFDDSRNGPAIQDLWMLLSGDYQQRCLQLADIMEGYSEFCDFASRELQLIEPLRAMRLMYYSAWLARRWEDPAFPHNFPWFNTERYWAEHILSLREQLAALDEPVLKLI